MDWSILLNIVENVGSSAVLHGQSFGVGRWRTEPLEVEKLVLHPHSRHQQQ